MLDGQAESAPLLGHKDHGPQKSVRRYLTERVDVHYALLNLLVCCFLVGLIDAASYNTWSVFMSMQTGMLCLQLIRASAYLSITASRKYHFPRPQYRQPPSRQRLLQMGPLRRLHPLHDDRLTHRWTCLRCCSPDAPLHAHRLLPPPGPLHSRRRHTRPNRCRP